MTQPVQLKTYPLPDGYTTRPIQFDDASEIATMLEIATHAAGDTSAQFNPEQLRKEWEQEDFSLNDSTLAVLSPAGSIIATATLWDIANPPVHPWLGVSIHPDYYESGVGEYLIDWLIDTSQRIIDRCPPDARISLRSGAKEGYEPREVLLKRMNFQPTRRWYDMRIDMTEAPPAAHFPEGFFIRHYKHPDDLHATIRADDAGFKDHWGHVDRPFEQQVKMWTHWVESDLIFDETLWFLVIEEATNEIAAVCLCRNEEWEDPTVAWVDSLAVLRPYRRKGIAMAMLHHAFGEFWRRGRKSVGLGVDASSITNATELYEKAGMHAIKVGVTWEYEIRDGVELATTGAEET
ncbi:MAG: GNAT family N-acetyltransferase [Aggregatilineales bacterium]